MKRKNFSNSMIQDISVFLELVSVNMDYESAIGICKSNGASQISCTKMLMKVYSLSLSEADNIVQNSVHWNEYKEGNESLKKGWFDTD